MCGIVAYTGKNAASRIILEGLKRLEYRGYDSAGLSIWNNNSLKPIKKTGRVDTLDREVKRT
ncbi:MAG TPA: glutamine--fructose-6-phosphate aminotransferase, partial [Opitutae bacterium]|nr:glutamine--fructose-6-phosphate aminotransferase [Opitutae bacterium]